MVEYPVTPGLASEGKKAGLKYRIYAGRFARCPDVGKLKPIDEGTVSQPRLDLIPKLLDDEYALTFEGYLEIPETGVWTLAIGSDVLEAIDYCQQNETLLNEERSREEAWIQATGRDKWPYAPPESNVMDDSLSRR